jgi:hypothetical protein
MCGHARTAGERYLKLARVPESSLKKMGTPCLYDHHIGDKDFEVKGHLNNIASQIVLTFLYLARHNRPEILWNLISYLHCTRDHIQFCFVVHNCAIVK